MDLDALESEIEELHKTKYGSQDAPTDEIDSSVDDDVEDMPDDSSEEAAPPKQEDFEHKYRVLQGKYTAELERMNSLLSNTLADRERLAAELESVRASKSSATLSDDSSNFDSDLEVLQSEYPTIAKGVKALLSKEMAERMARTEGAINNLAETTSRVVEDKYISSLDSMVPYWRQVKDNPEFSKWLSAQDRYTGQTRLNLLIGADRARNANTVAAFYEDFAREAGLLNDQSSSASTPQLSQSPQSRTQATTQSFSPSTAGNPSPSTASKGFITRAEISQFYKDRALGKFTGTEEDAAKIEGRILKAVREGKVR